MTAFLSKVIDPERPYRPAIDLALAALSNTADGDRNRGPAALASDAAIIDTATGGGGDAEGVETGTGLPSDYPPPLHLPESPRMMPNYDDARPDYPRSSGMVRGILSADRGGGGGGGGIRVGGSGGRRGGSGPGGGGGGYDHEYHTEYQGSGGNRDRSMPQVSSSWEADGHGGDMMPKVGVVLRLLLGWGGGFHLG